MFEPHKLPQELKLVTLSLLCLTIKASPFHADLTVLRRASNNW